MSELAELRWEYFYPRLEKIWRSSKGNKLTKGFYAMKTAHLKTSADWHYLRSICLDAERRGGSFSETFWGSLKVRAYQEPKQK